MSAEALVATVFLTAAINYAASHTQYDVPPNYPLPRVVEAERVLTEKDIQAEYDPWLNVIRILPGWDLSSVLNRATLVHEGVHWLQMANGELVGHLICELEQEAYPVAAIYYMEAAREPSYPLSAAQALAGICLRTSPRYPDVVPLTWREETE